MRTLSLIRICTSLALLVGPATSVFAQTPEPNTRQAVLEAEQAKKDTTLQPYVPTQGERLIDKVESMFVYPTQTWHPFFENAYRGGGFAAGLGYMWHASAYSYVDIRGSYSIKSYKRAEVEFVSPRLFHRRGELSLLGGWRDATEVGFYGIGIDTSPNNRVNYGFERPYGGGLLTVRPTRQLLLLRGGLDLSKWDMKSGTGGTSIEDVYTPETLPGVGATTTYLHTQGTVGLDWRPASGYARRGGFYGVTAHDYNDRDDRFGFRQLTVSRKPRCSRTTSRCRFSCCRRSAADPICVAIRAGASAIATACCCRPSGASWSIASWIRRCSTTPDRSPSTNRI
jgi:hypothetical protein